MILQTDLRRLKKLLTANYSGLLLEKFEQRRHDFEARLRKARRTPSEAAIHDLRVASRRLLALLTLLGAVVPSLKTKSVRRKIRRRLRDLRRIRDLQVQMAHTEKLLADFPQLMPFHKRLLREERRLAKTVTKRLQGFKGRKLRKSLDVLLRRLIGALDPENDSTLGTHIGNAIEDAHRRVLSRRARIDPAEAASIHRLRLAFKKFRYMAEIVAPVVSELDRERRRTMHAYQDRMGAIQDMESLLAAMMDFRRQSGRTSMLVVENELRRRRRRLIDEFMGTVDEVRFFWSPGQMESREVV